MSQLSGSEKLSSNERQRKAALDSVIDFLKTSPLPGSAVAETGEILYLNNAMNHITCSVDGNSNYTMDVAHFSHSSARHATSHGMNPVREKAAHISLLAAVRMPMAGNALVRLYSRETKGRLVNENDLIKKLVELASSSSGRMMNDGALQLDGDWLCRARLRDIVEHAIKKFDQDGTEIINGIDSQIALTATNPALVSQTIKKVLHELKDLRLKGKITIEGTQQESSGSTPNNILVRFTAGSRGVARKSEASNIKAAGLRLRSFCSRLGDLTELQIGEPSLFRRGNIVEAQLLIPYRLERISRDNEPNQHNNGNALSSREQEIVEMAKTGFDNVNISNALGITPSTVKQHLKAIYKKLGIKSRVELIFNS